MSVSTVITGIMAVFFVLGAFDRLFGNRLGMGAEFERGFGLAGPTALSMLGLTVLAPALARVLRPTLGALFALIGADAAMLPGMLMSCDIGYPISAAMSDDVRIAEFGGLVVGSVMGFVVSFTIPVACGLISKDDYRPFSTGIMAAYILDPLACFVGGIAMGLPAGTVLINLVPVIIIAAVIVLGLFFVPEIAIKAFRWFSKLLMAVITVGLVLGALESMLGLTIIEGLSPISDGFKTLGTVVLSLSGSLPFLYVMRKALKKPLDALGKRVGLNDVTVLSMIIAITSLVPGYSRYGEMNLRGKVVYAAFSASAGCALGAHLGFTSSMNSEVVAPMLLAKALAGVFALLSSAFFARRIFKDELARDKAMTAQGSEAQ
ncbi:MAG: ethanolamine utilization protein EutH [Oscillospiraceae bacterium]|nr:ethanolamine utilization protein EutH [Oscillospiraceae bacterium]